MTFSSFYNNLISFIVVKIPVIKKNLFLAQSQQTPEDYVKKMLRSSLSSTLLLNGAVMFFLFRSTLSNLFISIPLFIISYIFLFPFVFAFSIASIRSHVNNRRIEIERDLLFHGRYVLIKINSGTPLYNAILDSARISIGSNPFRDVSYMLKLGIPIEKAIEKEAFFSPSKLLRNLMKKILFSINTGADLTKILTSSFAQLSKYELIKVKEYNKKMGTIIILYTVIGIVAPCLGAAILIMVTAISGSSLGTFPLILIFGAIIAIQTMFILLVRKIRPQVNIW